LRAREIWKADFFFLLAIAPTSFFLLYELWLGSETKITNHILTHLYVSTRVKNWAV